MLDAADAGADRTGARAEAVPLEVSYHRISVRREEVIMSLVELCRLCRGQSDRIPIFEHGGYIPYKISFCLNIEVKESDERRTLCQLCYTKLNEFNEFKNMCRNTQEQGIGTGLAIKIKEEPKDEPPELDDLFTSIKVDPDLPPVRMIKLPFLFKEEDKKVQDCESDTSLDSLINQVQTDESEDGVPADPPEEQSSPPIADPPVEEQTSKTTKRKNEMTTPRRCKRQKVEAPKSARLTRSSTGVLQRKPIIDEEEEEEDVDDPDDDVADPDFNKDTDELQPMSSSSSEEETDKEMDREKDKEKDKAKDKEKDKEKEKEKEKEKAKDKSDDDDSDVECVVCRKTFVGSKALKEHMTEHLLVKKKVVHECKHCGETFPDKSKLICHNALKHSTKPKVQQETGSQCPECKKCFKNSGELICHKFLHHKKK